MVPRLKCNTVDGINEKHNLANQMYQHGSIGNNYNISCRIELQQELWIFELHVAAGRFEYVEEGRTYHISYLRRTSITFPLQWQMVNVNFVDTENEFDENELRMN